MAEAVIDTKRKRAKVEEPVHVRLEAKVPLAQMDEAARDAGLTAECF